MARVVVTVSEGPGFKTQIFRKTLFVNPAVNGYLALFVNPAVNGYLALFVNPAVNGYLGSGSGALPQ